MSLCMIRTVSNISKSRSALHEARQKNAFFSAVSRQGLEQPLKSQTSGLGLRSRLPPDSNSEPDPSEPPQISDQDWEIRTGRAIYVLQSTLPGFFQTGLITSIDKTSGTLRPNNSTPVVNANPLDYQTFNDDIESIYSPNIHLSYTPPVELPPPFPNTLHIEGLPLYLASSVFVRHTLNALYSDLNVTLHKFVVQTPKSPNPPVPRIISDASPESGEDSQSQSHTSGKRSIREKNLLVQLCVNGTARVSGSPGEWEVNSTYKFSPTTGLIQAHTVNSIYPAPHQAVYDALRASLGKVFGLGLQEGGTRTNGAACNGSGVGGVKAKYH